MLLRLHALRVESQCYFCNVAVYLIKDGVTTKSMGYIESSKNHLSLGISNRCRLFKHPHHDPLSHLASFVEGFHSKNPTAIPNLMAAPNQKTTANPAALLLTHPPTIPPIKKHMTDAARLFRLMLSRAKNF